MQHRNHREPTARGGPFWTPITPQTGSFFHAETQPHWAIVATLIQTAKLNEVDPLAWLTDVLERIVSGRTKHNELSALLPWTWKNNNPVFVNTG